MATQRFHLPVLVALLTACGDGAVTDPGRGAQPARHQGAATISVMTRNVYIGFNADAAVAALATRDPAVFLPALQQAIATLGRTDFSVRAALIADEIARTRPHAVGLQEVYRISADLTPLGLPVQIDLDYLAILQAALTERSLPYAAVAQVTNTDMRPLPGVQLLDRDVLLVDASRVQVRPGVVAQTFQYNIGPLADGIDKKAGYIAAPVTVDGLDLTIVTTHLESDLGPGTHGVIAQLRDAQVAEIVAVVGAAPVAIVMGDLNDAAGSPMYQRLTDAGFADVWTALNPGTAGNTASCFAPDLSDAAAGCTERIDMILQRGLDHPRAGTLGAAVLVGLDPAARGEGPAGPLWPSDHAGVMAQLLFPPAWGVRD